MGKTIKAWAMFIAIVLIPVVAIAAHFLQTSGTVTRRSAKTLHELPAVEDDTPIIEHRHSIESQSAANEPQAPLRPLPQVLQNAPTSTNEPSEPSAPLARPRKTDADREAELEVAFQSAGPAGTFEKSVVGKLRKLFDAKQVDALDCREGHCRMELSFQDAASAEKKLTEVFMAPDFDLGVAGTISSRSLARDGTVAVRVYLCRENPSAPEVGNE